MSKQAPVSIDTTNEQADWIKTRTWDLPRDPRSLASLLGDRWWERLQALPAWRAAPAEVKAAVREAERQAAGGTVVKFAPGLRPMLKHGDPSRPGYAQQHPNGQGAAPGSGEPLTPQRVADAFVGEYVTEKGLRFRLTPEPDNFEASEDGGKVVAGGYIEVDGQRVGEWARSVSGTTMEATLVQVGADINGNTLPGMERVRRQGIALEIQKQTEIAARELGCDTIVVSAYRYGGGAWAHERFGYRFSAPPLLRANPLKPMRWDPVHPQSVRDAFASFQERFQSDDPADWPRPHEILSLGGDTRYYGDIYEGRTYGEFLLSWGWNGVKPASHVTKAARSAMLHLIVKPEPGSGAPAVAKHGDPSRPGYAQQHPGSTASATATADLPTGWSRRSDADRKAEFMRRAREDWGAGMSDADLDGYAQAALGEVDEYDGPNGTVMTVDRSASIPPKDIERQMGAIATLQAIAPVKDLSVVVSDVPFESASLPMSTKGFVHLGGSQIHLRASAVTEGIDKSNGFLMPVFGAQPQLYSVVHEYGHVLDQRDARTAAEDKSIALFSHQTGISRYAIADEDPRAIGREAFAEAWTGWVGSQGRLAERPGFVKYFADKYGWDAGPPPRAGVAKAATPLILADTFTEEGASVVNRPPTVIQFAPGLKPVLKAEPTIEADNFTRFTHVRHTSQGRTLGTRPGEPFDTVAKHGDPSRPGYEAMHPNTRSGAPRNPPVPSAAEGRDLYIREKGMDPGPEPDYATIMADPARTRAIGAAYDALPMDDPKAHEAYKALASEVDEQYRFMTERLGITVEVTADDPYPSHVELMADLRDNGRLRVLATATTGGHPFFTNEQNDRFRAVHDFFGHAGTGRSFDRHGEEASWVSHSRMFSPLARQALTTETRGQNSSMIANGTGFPPQKVGVLPAEWVAVPAEYVAKAAVAKHGDPSRPGYAQQHPNSRGGGTRDVSSLLQEAKEQGGRMEIGWPVPPELRDRFDGVVEEDDANGREALGKALIAQARDYALLQGLRGDDVRLFAEAMFVRAESHARQRQAWESATPEERRGVKEVLDDVRRNGRVCIAADLDSAYEILTTERFASQFETGTSGGLLNERVRARSETAVQDLHPNVNDEHRPIYGYVASDFTHVGDAGVSQYGAVRFVLHDDVKDRATMTVGDSLNTYAIPAPMTGDISTRQAFEAVDRHPWASSPPPTDPREVRSFQQTNYFEAQIHEGVRIDDIDYIEIADRKDGTSYYSDIEYAAADAGIDVFYRY